MSLLSTIDHIETAEFQSSINVIESVINVNQKALAIIESYEGDDLSAFEVFQEASGTTIKTEGKKPGIIKRIIDAIKKLIAKIADFFKKDTTNKDVKDAEKQINDAESKFKKVMGKLSTESKNKAASLLESAKKMLAGLKEDIKSKKISGKVIGTVVVSILGIVASVYAIISFKKTKDGTEGLSDDQIEYFKKYIDFKTQSPYIYFDLPKYEKMISRYEKQKDNIKKLDDKIKALSDFIDKKENDEEKISFIQRKIEELKIIPAFTSIELFSPIGNVHNKREKDFSLSKPIPFKNLSSEYIDGLYKRSEESSKFLGKLFMFDSWNSDDSAGAIVDASVELLEHEDSNNQNYQLIKDLQNYIKKFTFNINDFSNSVYLFTELADNYIPKVRKVMNEYLQAMNKAAVYDEDETD